MIVFGMTFFLNDCSKMIVFKSTKNNRYQNNAFILKEKLPFFINLLVVMVLSEGLFTKTNISKTTIFPTKRTENKFSIDWIFFLFRASLTCCCRRKENCLGLRVNPRLLRGLPGVRNREEIVSAPGARTQLLVTEKTQEISHFYLKNWITPKQ